jgi:hypothetical protein
MEGGTADDNTNANANGDRGAPNPPPNKKRRKDAGTEAGAEKCKVPKTKGKEEHRRRVDAQAIVALKLTRSSNSGGGPCRLTSDAEANMTASRPYELLGSRSQTWVHKVSALGRMRQGRGDGYGEVSPAATLVTDRECVRVTTYNAPNAEEVTL